MRYLLITFVRKPNGQIDEAVTVSTKVRKSDSSMCNIILDYHEHKVEKCVVEGRVLDTDWERITAYYRSVYPTLIGELERSSPLYKPPAEESIEQQNGA